LSVTWDQVTDKIERLYFSLAANNRNRQAFAAVES
jgi:hypothetical protein